MWFLRVMVGLAAALISLAGIAWYAVYLFTPLPGRSVAPGPTADPLPARPPTPYERRQNRRSVGLGIAAVIGGLVLSVQALDSIRTGIPVQTLNETPTNGWVALAAALFMVVLGLWLAGAGIGVIRARHSSPDR